jgi:hypothetical protein
MNYNTLGRKVGKEEHADRHLEQFADVPSHGVNSIEEIGVRGGCLASEYTKSRDREEALSVDDEEGCGGEIGDRDVAAGSGWKRLRI